MKVNIRSISLVVNFLAIIAMSAVWPSQAQASCSLAGAAGHWGFSYSGTAITSSGGVPIAAEGHYSQNALGQISGTEVFSLAGTASDEVLKGQFTVNSNCTARLIANVYEGTTLVRTSTIDGIYVANSTEIKGIFRSVALPGGGNLPVVITVDAKKLFTEDEE
jgi:hypothetical protein